MHVVISVGVQRGGQAMPAGPAPPVVAFAIFGIGRLVKKHHSGVPTLFATSYLLELFGIQLLFLCLTLLQCSDGELVAQLLSNSNDDFAIALGLPLIGHPLASLIDPLTQSCIIPQVVLKALQLVHESPSLYACSSHMRRAHFG